MFQLSFSNAGLWDEHLIHFVDLQVYYYGMLAELRFQDSWTVALRALNEKLRDDERVDVSMLRLGDGLAVIVKR